MMQQFETAFAVLRRATAGFTASKFRFTLRATEAMYLPPYKGFALRGGFGYAFRQAVCVTRGTCATCLLQGVCLYPQLFEPAEQQRSGMQLARPFLFEPPVDAKRVYAVGEELEFAVVLFGRGHAYLPHFLLAFQILGEIGLGASRAKFQLVQVDAETLSGTRQVLFRFPQNRLAGSIPPIGWADVEATAQHLSSSNRVKLSFLTPTRLKSESELQRETNPELIVRAALRRFTQLAIDCAGADLRSVDFSAIAHGGLSCVIEKENLVWQEVERYSSRQMQHMSMGGLVGEVVIAGDLLPSLLPLLVWTEATHIGKNTVFGLGKVALSPA